MVIAVIFGLFFIAFILSCLSLKREMKKRRRASNIGTKTHGEKVLFKK